MRHRCKEDHGCGVRYIMLRTQSHGVNVQRSTSLLALDVSVCYVSIPRIAEQRRHNARPPKGKRKSAATSVEGSVPPQGPVCDGVLTRPFTHGSS